MVLGMLTVILAASLVAAVCGAVCLRRLTREDQPAEERAEDPESGGDRTLREGILNLMGYEPGKEKEEA